MTRRKVDSTRDSTKETRTSSELEAPTVSPQACAMSVLEHNLDFNKRSKDSPGRSPVLLHESASSTSNVTKVTVGSHTCPSISALTLNLVVQVQTAPSSAELNAQQVARLLHSLSGPVINCGICWPRCTMLLTASSAHISYP
jgi:hypothetical protein